MEIPQNSPKSQVTTLVTNENGEQPTLITAQQQAWIDYNAMSGLITDLTTDKLDKDGQPAVLRKMTITEFAKLLEVDRKTLRNWRETIPDFWKRVNDRRAELSTESRLAKMHEVWYLSALKSGKDGFKDRQLWLANFDPKFKMPAQKIEHEAGNSWAALLRKKVKVIEGEVVNESGNDQPGSVQQTS